MVCLQCLGHSEVARGVVSAVRGAEELTHWGFCINWSGNTVT